MLPARPFVRRPPERRPVGPRVLTACAAMLGLVVSACSSSGADDPAAGDGEVVVFAAASLTEAFAAVGDAFMLANPGIDVTFEFAGSTELAGQLVNGAPADVFASADRTSMATVVGAGLAVGAPAVFATNTLQIVTTAGNPRAVANLDDLAAADLIVVLCAEEVPCGRYSRQMLDAAGVSVTPRSFEQNVKGVLSKVSLGEADAGIVYRTDVIAAGDAVTGVEVDPAVAVTADYPVVTTSGSDAATAFVAFLFGDVGRAILATFGFGAP